MPGDAGFDDPDRRREAQDRRGAAALQLKDDIRAQPGQAGGLTVAAASDAGLEEAGADVGGPQAGVTDRRLDGLKGELLRCAPRDRALLGDAEAGDRDLPHGPPHAGDCHSSRGRGTGRG